MSRSLSTGPAGSRAVAWSVRLYQWLLLAYPARFRASYGGHMTQAFRDSCRQAQREGGLWGVGRLWPRTLADLGISALAERWTGGNRMARWTPARFYGVAAMLGGAIWLGMMLFSVGAFILSVISQGAVYSGLNPAASYVFEATWILFPIALLGLLGMAAGRVGLLAWLGFTIALVGGLMLLVGGLGTTFVWSSNAGLRAIKLTGYDAVGENLKLALYTISFVGYPVLGIGLALVGLLLWRARALPRLNTLPLALGIFVALQYFFTDMGAPSLLRNTGTPGLVVMIVEITVFVLAWAVGWILLGRMLWTSAEVVAPELPGQSQPAEMQPAA